MSNNCKPVWPHWMLTAATATGLWVTPWGVGAQTVPVPASVSQSPSAAPAPSAESPVQRELRRLYEESGREMPTIPPYVQQQMQARSQPAPPAPSASPGNPRTTQQSTPTGPSPSAPTHKRDNPVVSFFKKLVPGGQSKPATPQTAATPPRASAPSATPHRAAPPQYAPYAAQPPRRLPPTAGMTATPAVPPPEPQQNYIVISPTSPGPNVPPGEIAQVPAQGTTLPQAASAPALAHPLETEGPRLVLPGEQNASSAENSEFEPPLIVDEREANRSAQPHLAHSHTTTPDPAQEVGTPAPGLDLFPDPFTELSEAEADRKLRGAIEPQLEALAREEAPASEFATAHSGGPGTSSPAANHPLEEPLAVPPPILGSNDPRADTESDLPLLPPPTSITAGTDAPRLAVPAAPSLSPATPSLTEVQAGPTSGAAPQPAAPPARMADSYEEKMAKIRERGGMKGLKGFCPVALRDDRELKDAIPDYHATYRGQKFHFSSAEAKAKFEEDPRRYAPAAYGADVVILLRDRDVIEGTLDFAAWYKGRLYLFASEENHALFTEDPAKFALPQDFE